MPHRLSWGKDVCALPWNPQFAWRCSEWNRGTFRRTESLEHGFVQTVIDTRFFVWKRYFTRDGYAPELLRKEGRGHRLLLEEWVPGVWPFPQALKGWTRLGRESCDAVSVLPNQGEVYAFWSKEARREARLFREAGCRVRLGSWKELHEHAYRSHVPRELSEAMLGIFKRQMENLAETTEILIAIDAQGALLGGIGVGYDAQLSQSFYFCGYFLPEAAALHPMAGLFETWFQRTRERGLRSCNFGGILGPDQAKKRHPWWGFSYFKMQFNVTRMHLPPGFWKLRME